MNRAAIVIGTGLLLGAAWAAAHPPIVADYSLEGAPRLSQPTQRPQIGQGVVCVNVGRGARCVQHSDAKHRYALDTCAYAEAQHRLIYPFDACVQAELGTSEDAP